MPRIAPAGSQDVQRRPGWQNIKRATAGANAFASSKSASNLLRFAEVKGVSQESELQVETRTLRAELATCEAEREADLKAMLPPSGSDERVAFVRHRSDLHAAEAEVKRLSDVNTKLKRGLEQEALVTAATNPLVKEARQAAEAETTKAREEAEVVKAGARAEVEAAKAEAAQLVKTAQDETRRREEVEAKLAAEISRAQQAEEQTKKAEHPQLLAAGSAAAKSVREEKARADYAEKCLAKAQQGASSAQEEVAKLRAEMAEAAKAAEERVVAANAEAAAAKAEASSATKKAEAEAATYWKAEAERKAAKAVEAARAEARAEAEAQVEAARAEITATMQSELDEAKADIQQQQTLLQANADRAVEELDKGMRAAWQIAEEAEQGRELAMKRVEELESLLRETLEADEDGVPYQVQTSLPLKNSEV